VFKHIDVTVRFEYNTEDFRSEGAEGDILDAANNIDLFIERSHLMEELDLSRVDVVKVETGK